MQKISNNHNTFQLSLSREELNLICNALNEVRNGIDMPDFSTRLGASEEEADTLLTSLSRILDKTDSA